MWGQVSVRAATACVVASAISAGAAQAAVVRGYEVRPGVPGVYFQADPGENNDLRLIAQPVPKSTSPGVLVVNKLTVIDDGAPLRTGGDTPCTMLSAHKALCTTPSFYTKVHVHLTDGSDRVRMPARKTYPATQIYPDASGPNRFTLRGPTSLMGAYTGDRVRFLPPGGGSVIIGGSPSLWLVDGAAEHVDCRSPGNPRIFSDPLDTFSYYC